jgi:O-succinylbenzoic acid--CoA ligase
MPVSSVSLNGRDIRLSAIEHGEVQAFTPFEEEVFNFMRAWLSGVSSFVVETSGSTGPPKKIELTRSQMQASSSLTQQALQLIPGQHALICLDPRFIAGKMMLVRALEIGMAMTIVEPTSHPLAYLPSERRVDFTAWVPYQLYRVLESPQSSLLNNIGNLLIGGAPLDESAVKAMDVYRCRCYATYGMTETITHIALRLLNGPGAESCFRALPGIDLSTDERGCLIIQAAHLPEPVVTNDLVRLADRQHFEWLGRWDNVINSGGKKVTPEKLEAIIKSTFLRLNIHDPFIVSSLPDPLLGERIILIMERDVLPEEVKQLIQNGLEHDLEKHLRPKEIKHVREFRYTKNGKIDRTAIKLQII